ncbi:MAG: hypothetical protein B7Z08_03635 [Sphingomonadales bacterium 32-68-7]|nr:MAG: hypothetical protein B7Z33_05460 [Sphingomonadales bacterium 12-68-11]OYX09842.1 MAG: hypothetical protein B7Z08_03635 [Sphingomonadales bacterium 32-68-7]
MNRGRISRQSAPLFAAAVLMLAAILALAVWFNTVQQQRRAAIESEALESARRVVALADAEVQANRRMLTLIAGAPGARAGDLARIGAFFELAIDENTAWRGLVLREVATGEVLLERGRADDARALSPLPRTPDEDGVEGILREGRYCPCVAIHMPVADWPDRVMTLYLSPGQFQSIAARLVAPTSLGALVDSEGRFIARTLDYAERVGTPGSRFLREAAAKGGEGIYQGVTLEGVANYTAYASSADSGWSAHVAVGAEQIDDPRWWSTASIATAAIAALALAGGLLLYAAFEMRARRAEQQRMLEMQKAEAISRFTSTVVHDFRNILAVIQAGTRLILRHAAGREIEGHARAMQDAVERGNRLINQLLSFVRGDGAEVGPIDLAKLLGGADELIARSLGDGIEFKWTVADNARYAIGNADQVELALLNLAVNARDAMEGEGRFTLHTQTGADGVEIVACDSGPGVPPQLRERIFEAFYSTKPEGKGTGLGLAQVAGAARQAGGSARLGESPLGGACIVMVLPRGEAPAA